MQNQRDILSGYLKCERKGMEETEIGLETYKLEEIFIL